MSISALFKGKLKRPLYLIFSLLVVILILIFINKPISNLITSNKSDHNSALHFMEIENKDINYKFSEDMLEEISKIDGIEYAFFNYDMKIEVLKENEDVSSSSDIIPVSKEYLGYFGVEGSVDTDKFFLLNNEAVDSELFNDNEEVDIYAHIPVIKDGNIYGKPKRMNSYLTRKFSMPSDESLYFPPGTSIMDPESFEKLFDVEENNIKAAKIVAICKDVNDMKSVCKEIEHLDNSLVVRYARKTKDFIL